MDNTRTTIYPDHAKTPGKNNLNDDPPPCCGLLFVFGSLPLPSSWLVPRLAFFTVLLLFLSWTHHLSMD